jgi:hypothetical protein
LNCAANELGLVLSLRAGVTAANGCYVEVCIFADKIVSVDRPCDRWLQKCRGRAAEKHAAIAIRESQSVNSDKTNVSEIA